MKGRILPELQARLRRAVLEATGIAEPVELMETADSRFGDYQSNVALQLASKLNSKPRELAARLLTFLDTEGMCESPEIAGPGFINFRISRTWLGQEISRAVSNERFGIEVVERPQQIVVDLSSPNIAKRMHVGHLRSTIIGDTLVRTLRFLGHEVIGDNHLGDWGTQFGILIWAFKHHRNDAAIEADPIGELERLYKLGNELSDSDPGIAEACRSELAKLQREDPENIALWRRFVELSQQDQDKIYKRLSVSFDLCLGESSYRHLLDSLLERLTSLGLARVSEGALVVFFPDDPELADHPCIVRKSDGAFLYATTDVATVIYRAEELKAQRIIYVVDIRQALHFKQVFAIAQGMGYQVSMEHVGFGMMLASDGRPFRTRTGGTITLESLLDEAEERILPVVKTKWPELGEEECRLIAAEVGTGAIKYSDLSQNLMTDYRFDWDRMLSPDGNTGPYLQYTRVRMASVLRTFAEKHGRQFLPEERPLVLDRPEELSLGIKLLQFGDVLDRTAGTLRPHILCDFLYGVARSFNAFYATHSILGSEEDIVRYSRLMLTLAADRVLSIGLSCLNISVVSRM